eukprot:jgi/Tetstr1/461321/TSEL_006448.t1
MAKYACVGRRETQVSFAAAHPDQPMPISRKSATLTPTEPIMRPIRAPAADRGVRYADDENQWLLDSHGDDGDEPTVEELAGDSAEPDEYPEDPPARPAEEREPASCYPNKRTSDGHGPPRRAYFRHGAGEDAMLPPLWFFF